MNMKNIMKYLVAAVLSVSLLSSCIQETFPTSTATKEQLAQSPAAMDAMVNAITTAMVVPGSCGAGNAGYQWDFGLPSLFMARDFMCEDIVTLGDDGYNWFFYFGANQGLADMYYMCLIGWNNYYPWIKGCNDIITAGAEGDYLGIALAYRAMFYLDMVRMYEYAPNKYTDGRLRGADLTGLAVPLVDENTTEEAAANNPRATVEQIYDRIFDDLNRAEEALATYSRPDATRPNLAVVYGLKARAYLERGKVADENYAKAAEYARKAIDASGCSIMTEAEWFNVTDGFNKPNNSWMWAMGQSSENISNLLNYVSFLSPEATWGYGSQVFYGINKATFEKISQNDWRRNSWIAPERTHNYKTNMAAGKAFIDELPDYCNLKFRPMSGETIDQKTGGATYIPLMRVEEMYLIEAEATAKANLAAGQQLLQEFMSHRLASGNYYSTASSFEDFQREILLQKRIEFWAEGIVYFDYKRIRAGINRGYEGTNFYADYRFNCEEIAPWWNFVIPRSEYNNNSGITSDLNNPDPSESVVPWTGQ